MTSSQLVPEMTALLITHNLKRIFHCIYIFDKVYIGAISSDITFESFKNYNLWKKWCGNFQTTSTSSAAPAIEHKRNTVELLNPIQVGSDQITFNFADPI